MFYALSKILFFLIRPSNALLFGLALGWILRWFGRRRSGATILAVSFTLLLAAAFTGLSSALLAPLETRFPAIAPPAEPPTGVIVLGGAIDTVATVRWNAPQLIDGAERVVAMADLARRYPDARLVFTGGHMNLLEGEEPEAALAARVFETFGIPPERLTLETASRNTRENAVNTYEIVKPQAGETWLLVTSAFHMPRAMGVFRAAGWTGLTAYPVDFRSLEGVPVIGRQFASEGLFLTDIAVKEWLGLIAYRFAGYTGAIFPGP
ncbi:MAG TPA: YdcF family protein [Methylomirabilota bacterium]|nr:YdcF family protein [Methylomirabilota bacterium]